MRDVFAIVERAEPFTKEHKVYRKFPFFASTLLCALIVLD
jgi:hypothetical protein